MEIKLANPAPLGLIGFASTTWLLSMVNAGWYDTKSLVVVLAMALVFGGVVQAIAGVLAFFRGNTFAGVAFLSYGAFWISLVTFEKFFGGGAPASFVGWYLFVWGVFSFYMWIATFRHNMALQSVFLALWITFLLLAVGAWFDLGISHTAGGYLGLVTALLAAYLSAAELINGEYGRTVPPIGALTPAPAESPGRQEVFMEPKLGMRG
jgi:succinate-acetate transporter protein